MKRPWLLPLEPAYRMGLELKNAAYERGRLRVRRLERPVFSVGSLSVGGAGKTPVVLALAALLGRDGHAADVLSRGYGRTSRAVLRVDKGGRAEQFGDEPLELARAGLEVVVGAERYEAGLLAERTGAAKVHLLDDGFQHRRLARTLDLVVLTLADVRDRLLPAGNLREPLGSLKRADALVLREEEAEEIVASLPRMDAAVWLVRRELVVPADAAPLAFAFTAIARPESFFGTLAATGQRVVGQLAFADHHRYSPADCERMLLAARKSGASGFVTTAKDAVKLTPELLAMLGPVSVARLRTSFLEEQERVLPRLRQALRPVH